MPHIVNPCGDYLPGQIPIDVVRRDPPSPPILVSSPKPVLTPAPFIPTSDPKPIIPGIPTTPNSPVPSGDELLPSQDPTFLASDPKQIPGAAVSQVQQLPTANGESFDVLVLDVEKLASQQQVMLAPPLGNSNSQLYHNSFNFFSTQLVYGYETNYSYLNIFKSEIPSVVAYLINNQGSESTWNESNLFSLTLENVKQSLKESLLSSFQQIHRAGGQLVDERHFLEAVRRHLLEGTLDEFDYNYYLELASRQKNDERIAIQRTINRESSELAALELVSQKALTADSSSSNLENIQLWQSRRSRRFNTDIDARVTVELIDNTTNKELYLTDAGIDVELIDETELSVPIGNGDGYYMHISKQDNTNIPIVTTNNIKNTYYVPPNVRVNALSITNKNSSYVITASSVTNQNEFVSGDLGPSAFDPLYCILDLRSLHYTQESNPIFCSYGGDYKVETNQDIIDEHSINNGMAVSKVNIDYRDPIYRYILDSGKVSMTLNDINLKSLVNSSQYSNGKNISRNMPFALIITPVAGSKFNPFNSQSNLDSFTEPFIRSMSLDASMDVDDFNESRPELTELVLYDETSGDSRVGLVEPEDIYNRIYKFNPSNEIYLNNFYKDGSYVSSVSAVSSNGVSYLVKDVIDYIIDTYGSGVVTWYDVIRRMPLNRVGELLYSLNDLLVDELGAGFRRGLNIKSVLNTFEDPLGSLLPDDDRTIIKLEER
jgi:hypothetical protein